MAHIGKSGTGLGLEKKVAFPHGPERRLLDGHVLECAGQQRTQHGHVGEATSHTEQVGEGKREARAHEVLDV